MSVPLNSLRQFALAAVVAAGLAVAWCVLVAWVLGLAQSAAMQSNTYEQPYFRQDGEVVILRYPLGIRSTDQEVTDLSGQVSPANASQLLATNPLYGRSHIAITGSTDWRGRLAGVNDGGRPLTYWYLVHDGRVNGSAYGVGYHSITKQLAGYFGRQGFTTTRPPRDDWFAVEGSYGLSLATTGAINTEPSWTTEQVMYLQANGKLWSIDPRKKWVQALTDAPSSATIGWIWNLKGVAPAPPSANPALQTAAWAPRTLVIRTDDALTLVDPESGQHRTIPLPAELQGSMLAGCELAGGGLSLISYGGTTITQANAAWRLDPQGKIVQQQAMHIRPYSSDLLGEANMGWFSLLAGPFPAGQVPLVFVMPMELVQSGQADSYWSAFVPNLRRAWPGIVGALVIGVLSAAAAYRRQRRYSLPSAIGWAIFAFLFGLPGWIAYRWHRTWPVLAECPACDQPAPRNRDACTECGAVFPPPELKGLEVFA